MQNRYREVNKIQYARKSQNDKSGLKKLIYKLILLLLWPLAYGLSSAASYYPQLIETHYSQGLAALWAKLISSATGVIPVSVAEVLIICFFLGVSAGLIRSIWISIRNIRLRKRTGFSISTQKKEGGLFSFLLNLSVILGVIYFTFMMIWGLNYHRLSFAEIAGFKQVNVSQAELEDLYVKLINQANKLRPGLTEDNNGVMMLKGSVDEIGQQAVQSYTNVSGIYPELAGQYSRPKPVYFSTKMSYMGISGIYFPFTAEANVNIDIPDSMLPATMCHELAHQRGFAREDEANYIAWVACNSSSDPSFQYSGVLLALIHTMNAYHLNHPEKAGTLSTQIGQDVKRDLKAISDYWQSFAGKAEEITSDVNDSYLKSNRQEDGVKSYGRMVDLLIAEQHSEPAKRFLP